MDMFENVNDGKDLGYFMKKMLGKKIAEAFQPLCKKLKKRTNTKIDILSFHS